MRKFKKIAATLISLAICLTAFALVACNNTNKQQNVQELALSFGQSTAYFADGDSELYPIAGTTPSEGEAIEKSIKLTFANAAKVGLSLEFAGDAPSGLRYSVDNGEAEAPAAATIWSSTVAATETEKTVKLKVWLAADATDDVAGADFVFTVTAGASTDSNATAWEKTVSNQNNTVAIGQPDTPFVWSDASLSFQTSGIVYATVDGTGTPIDLTALFAETTTAVTFTPTGGTETAVEDCTAFSPAEGGTLKLTATAPWRTPTTIEVPVTVEAQGTVTFDVTYPAWYVETGDEITVTATADDEPIDVDIVAKGDGTYAAQLAKGTYDFTIASARFRSSATDETVTKTGVTVDGAQNLGNIAFTVPKLTKDTGSGATITYSDSGFEIGQQSGTYYRLDTVTANEGFVIGYTMQTPYRKTAGWGDGGFCFKIDTIWYTLVVQPPRGIQQGSAVVYIGAQGGGAMERIYTSSVAIAAATAEAPSVINAKIAYYDGAFYLQVNDGFAARLGAELLAVDGHCRSNACPIRLLSDKYEQIVNSLKVDGESRIDTYFGAGVRTLGFRTVDYVNTFTNVEYALGNDAAKAAIEDMYEIAVADTKHPICNEEHGNPWASWLPYVWSDAAKATAEDGFAVTTLNGAYKGEPIDLTATFGVPTLTAKFTPAGGTETDVIDPTAFEPTQAGTLTVVANAGYANTPLTADVTVTETSTVTFTVTYPQGVDGSGDTISATATKDGSSTPVSLVLTQSDATYTAELVNGTYDFTITSSLYKKDNTTDDVVITGTVVNNATTLSGVVFTMGKGSYVWSDEAQALVTSGIVGATLDGVSEPIDLTDLFKETTLTAKFTPADGTETDVTDPTQFAPTGAGSLVVDHGNSLFNPSPLTVAVTVTAKSTVTFEVTYPNWYQETGDVITISASTDGGAAIELALTAKGDNTYTAVVVNGAYDFTVSSARFRTASAETIAANANITDTHTVDSIVFTTPKLDNAGNVTYYDNGFRIPIGNTQFRPLAGGVVADEGFTVSYDIQVYNLTTDKWLSGGFCFKIGNKWYTMNIYPKTGFSAAADLEKTQWMYISLVEQVAPEGTPNTISFKNVFYMCAGLQVKPKEKLHVEVAYYNDATVGGGFYIRMNNTCAVRLSADMFKAENGAHSSGDNWPIWITTNEYAKFNKTFTGTNASTYGTITPSEYFGVGDRVLGFRAGDCAYDFTDVQYALGDEAAIDLIKSMRVTADAMTSRPIDNVTVGNRWPEFPQTTQTPAMLEAVPAKKEENE